MRCLICDTELTDREATIKALDFTYLDCCSNCIRRDNMSVIPAKMHLKEVKRHESDN